MSSGARYDNSPVHKSRVTLGVLHKADFAILNHPRNSADLLHSDLYLFPELKNDLCAKKFRQFRRIFLRTNVHRYSPQPTLEYKCGTLVSMAIAAIILNLISHLFRIHINASIYHGVHTTVLAIIINFSLTSLSYFYDLFFC